MLCIIRKIALGFAASCNYFHSNTYFTLIHVPITNTKWGAVTTTKPESTTVEKV